jgi:glycerophosphoryl diester phosphodiesterase
MAAFEAAVALGITLIECDVNLTRDGVLVMMHDATVDRTTDGHGYVGDLDWAEVQRLDAGGKFHPRFAGARVPTTRDTLRYFHESGITGCFEVKGRDTQEAQQVAGALADLLLEMNALDYAIMSSFDHAALALAKAKVPALTLAPERLPEHGPPHVEAAVQQAQALGAAILQHRIDRLTPAVMDALHDRDVAVWAWPTDDEQSLADSLALGVDGVIGDDVTLMQSVFDRLAPGTG